MTIIPENTVVAGGGGVEDGFSLVIQQNTYSGASSYVKDAAAIARFLACCIPSATLNHLKDILAQYSMGDIEQVIKQWGKLPASPKPARPYTKEEAAKWLLGATIRNKITSLEGFVGTIGVDYAVVTDTYTDGGVAKPVPYGILAADWEFYPKPYGAKPTPNPCGVIIL